MQTRSYKSALAIISRPELFDAKRVLDAAALIFAADRFPNDRLKAYDLAQRVLSGEQKTARAVARIRTLGTV
jgi:hypothetical protein